MKLFLLILALFVFATPIFAQAPEAAAAINTNWTAVGVSIAMAIASGLCALGQGKAVGSAAEALARNPGAAGHIRFALIFGLALIESLALYTLVIILLQ